MRERRILDYLGRDTGARMAHITWRSKPTLSPLTKQPVRCIVVEDGKGQFWTGHRAGSKDGVGSYEFYSEPLKDRGEAIVEARNSTRSYLACQAEFYSERTEGKRPGREIVRVTMDDGWSVAIRATEGRMDGVVAEKPLERLVSTRDISNESAGNVDVRTEMHVRGAEKRAGDRVPGGEAKKILDSFGKPKRGRVGKLPSGGRRIEGPSR
jgi:hypothetical protein